MPDPANEYASAARVARRRNRAAARTLPLFAATGVLDQVVPPSTAEQVLTQRAACRQEAAAREARSATHFRTVIAAYRAAYAAAGGDVAAAERRCAAARLPLPPMPWPPLDTTPWFSGALAYLADWWNGELARYFQLPPREIAARYHPTPAAGADSPAR